MKAKLESGYAEDDDGQATSSSGDKNTVILMKMDKKTGMIAPASSIKDKVRRFPQFFKLRSKILDKRAFQRWSSCFE